jgi:hypothetical protein
MKPEPVSALLAAAIASMALGSQIAEACSRLLWHNALCTYVGRNEDWFEDAPRAAFSNQYAR